MNLNLLISSPKATVEYEMREICPNLPLQVGFHAKLNLWRSTADLIQEEEEKEEE